MQQTLVFTLLVALSTIAAAEPEDDVRCREIGFSQSVEAQDMAAFVSYIDADARFVSDSVARGPEAIAAGWQVFFADYGPKIRWRPQFIEVLEDGTLALSRGPYRMVTTDEDGKQSEHWGTYNSIWRLQSDGSWKIVFDAGSPATESPTDAVRALLEQADDCGQ